jgi:hypothetical protein
MTPKKLEEWEDEWQAAEAALKAAQKMPGGPERIAGELDNFDTKRIDAGARLSRKPSENSPGFGPIQIRP